MLNRIVLVAGLCACASMCGCGSTPVAETSAGDPAGANLQQIMAAYRDATEKLGRPPMRLEDIKPYLKGNVDEILKSPRDGQPFVIVWGVDIKKLPPTFDIKQMPVIIYEKQGAGGKRWVMKQFSPQELTDEEFAQANIPKSTGK